ncbi:MAG TPA: hypothetical protein VGI94_12820 [Reyranella sp.]|jgi:hypothetical protein
MVELLDFAVDVHGGVGRWKALQARRTGEPAGRPAVAIDFTAVKAA